MKIVSILLRAFVTLILTMLLGAMAVAQTSRDGGAKGYQAKPTYFKFNLKRGMVAPPPAPNAPFLTPEDESAERDDFRGEYNPAPFYSTKPRQVDGASTFSTEAPPQYHSGFNGSALTGFSPPDPSMAVGPSDLVSTVNSNLTVRDKDGTFISSVALTTMLGSSQFIFDPHIRYDIHRNRFVGVAMGHDGAPNRQNARWWIFFSNDSTGEGAWSGFAMNARVNGATDDEVWVDYPHIGYTNDAIAVTGIAFNTPFGAGDSYGKIRFVDAVDLYNGGGIAWKDYWGMDSGLPYVADSPDKYLYPVTSLESPTRFWVMSSKHGGGNILTAREFDDTAGGNFGNSTTLLGTYEVPVAAYALPPNPTQLGGGTAIDNIDCRLLQADYINGHTWTVHPTNYTDSGGINRSSVKAYRLNMNVGAAPTIVFDEIFGANGADDIYPAIGATVDNDAILCFSRTSSSQYISMRYTGFQDGAAGFESSAQLKAGEANYVNLDNSGRNRWGDYFACALDPTDDRTIWMHGQYAETGNNWGSWIAAANYKPNHVVTVSAVSIQQSDTGNLTAVVRRSDTNAVLSGVTVTFYVSGVLVGSDVTDAGGVATRAYTVADLTVPQNRTITATTTSQASFNEDTGTGVLTITKADTAIQVTNEAGVIGQTIPILAQLKRIPDDQLLGGETVNFTVNGVAAGSDVTDGNGYATINYTIVNGPGVYNIVASYAGDSVHNADSANSTLTVSKGGTVLAVNSPSGQRTTQITFSTTLKRTSDNAPLSGRQISWNIDGLAPIFSNTNASGVATLNYIIPAGAALGSAGHTVVANFFGDATYLANSDGGNWTVLGPSFNGNVSFLDWTQGDAGQQISVTIRNNADLIVQGPTNVVTTTNGNWQLFTSLAAGTYKVSVKGDHWLRQQKTNISLPNTTTGTALFSHDLTNGDEVSDNVIDLSDYTVIVSQFNSSGPAGDLNGDRIVDLTDYTIVITNFNRIGDN
ncbi:MAG: Ig-like domain repeat protein [Armatimonadetes bacterium]|nr:Ig-like domain repeat protein [Armatimonadota bacterium]